MSRKPRVPMSPEELPQQRLYLVRGLPHPPPGWAPVIGEGVGLAQQAMPRGARYVGQLEWSWSPMHSRISAYFLSMDRSHRRWLLWMKPYDSNWCLWDKPTLEAMSRRSGLTAKVAAQLLLCEVWKDEVVNEELDRFHWIGETALLSAGELSNLADAVWGDEPAAEDDL